MRISSLVHPKLYSKNQLTTLPYASQNELPHQYTPKLHNMNYLSSPSTLTPIITRTTSLVHPKPQSTNHLSYPARIPNSENLNGNKNYVMEYAHKCGGVKPIHSMPTVSSYYLDIQQSNKYKHETINISKIIKLPVLKFNLFLLITSYYSTIIQLRYFIYILRHNIF